MDTNTNNSNGRADKDASPRPNDGKTEARPEREMPAIAEVVRNAIHLNTPLVLFIRDGDRRSEDVNDWLGKRKIPHTVIDCTTDPRGDEMLREIARTTDGEMTTPKVFLRGYYLGSADNVLRLADDGELEELFADRQAFYDANRSAIVHPLPSGPRSDIHASELLAKKAEISFKASAKRLSDSKLPFTERAAAAAEAVAAKASSIWQSMGTTAPAPAEKAAPPASPRRAPVSSQ